MLPLVRLFTLVQNFSMSTPNLINVPHDTFEVAMKEWTSFPVTAASLTNLVLNLPDAALGIDEDRTQRSPLNGTALQVPAAATTGIGLAVGASREAVDPDVGIIFRYNLDFSCDIPFTHGGNALDAISVRMLMARSDVQLSGADPYIQTTNFMMLPGGAVTFEPALSYGALLDFTRVHGSCVGTVATFGTGLNVGEALSIGVSFVNTSAFNMAIRNFLCSMSLHYWTADQQTLNPNI